MVAIIFSPTVMIHSCGPLKNHIISNSQSNTETNNSWTRLTSFLKIRIKYYEYTSLLRIAVYES